MEDPERQRIHNKLHELFSEIEREYFKLYEENLELKRQLNIPIPTSTTRKTRSLRGKTIKRPQLPIISEFSGHYDLIWDIMCHDNSTIAGTASADSTCTIFNYNTGSSLKYLGHEASVNSIRFHEDHVVTASGDKTCHVWKFNSEQLIQKEPASPSQSIMFAEHLYTEDEAIKAQSPKKRSIVPLTIKKPDMILQGHSDTVSCADWNEDQIVSGSWDNSVKVWAESGMLISTLRSHENSVTDVATSKSKMVLSSSMDKTCRLWDTREARNHVIILKGHSGGVRSVSFSGVNNIVSGGDDKTVKIWDTRRPEEPIHSTTFPTKVNRISVGIQIAIPLDDGSGMLCDLNGKKIATLNGGHSKIMSSASWSYDSRFIITAGMDMKTCLWSLDL